MKEYDSSALETAIDSLEVSSASKQNSAYSKTKSPIYISFSNSHASRAKDTSGQLVKKPYTKNQNEINSSLKLKHENENALYSDKLYYNFSFQSRRANLFHIEKNFGSPVREGCYSQLRDFAVFCNYENLGLVRIDSFNKVHYTEKVRFNEREVYFSYSNFCKNQFPSFLLCGLYNNSSEIYDFEKRKVVMRIAAQSSNYASSNNFEVCFSNGKNCHEVKLFDIRDSFGKNSTACYQFDSNEYQHWNNIELNNKEIIMSNQQGSYIIDRRCLNSKPEKIGKEREDKPIVAKRCQKLREGVIAEVDFGNNCVKIYKNKEKHFLINLNDKNILSYCTYNIEQLILILVIKKSGSKELEIYDNELQLVDSLDLGQESQFAEVGVLESSKNIIMHGEGLYTIYSFK